MFQPIYDLRDQAPASKEAMEVAETFRVLKLNNLVQEVFVSMKKISTQGSVIVSDSTLHEAFIKLFRFLNILSKEDGITKNTEVSTKQAVNVIIEIARFYADIVKTNIKTTLNMIGSCLRLNLVSMPQLKAENKDLESILINILEFLRGFLEQQGFAEEHESFVIAMDFYIKLMGIEKYEDIQKSMLGGRPLVEDILTVNALLLLNVDVGTAHFTNLLEKVSLIREGKKKKNLFIKGT